MSKVERITCVAHGGNPIGLNNFYVAGDESIFRGIGHIAICKRCIYELAENYYKYYGKNMRLAIYYTCRKIDVGFDDNVLEGSINSSLSTGNKEVTPTRVIQSYMRQVNSLGRINDSQLSFDRGEHIYHQDCSCENGSEVEEFEEIKLDMPNFVVDDEMKVFWGGGFEREDYFFLETEMDSWKKTHKCDNQAETTLLKEICITILEIRKLREQQQPVTKFQKDLQDLMKTASVDPAKANVADHGKSLDAYGLWLKDIERNEPADFFADKELFKDFDGIKTYVNDYIYRPLRNLLTGSRDFDIERGDD